MVCLLLGQSSAGRVGGRGVGLGGGVSSSGARRPERRRPERRPRREPRPRRGASAAFFSCSAAASRATCDSGAWNSPAALVRLPFIAPASLASRTSRRLDVGEAGDLARRRPCGPRRTPPLTTSSGLALREVAERLGGLDRVALDEGDRGRAGEQRGQVGETDRVRRPLRQGVLDDGVAAARTEGTAQLGQLRHGQPAVLGEHGRTRVLEPLGDLGDRRGLRLRGHGPPLVCRATTGRRATAGDRRARRRGTPRRRAHGARGGRTRRPPIEPSSCAGRPELRDLRSHADVRRPAVLGGTCERRVPRQSAAGAAGTGSRRAARRRRRPRRTSLTEPWRGAAQAVGSSTGRLRVRFGSTGMPGPIVVVMVTFFR